VQDRRAQAADEERPIRSRSLEAFVLDFAAMSEEKRRAFLRGIVESIPQDLFVDLLSAAPPGKLDYEHADIYMRATTGAERFRLRGCAKEPFTVAWIHEHVGAGDVLYDIGANVGVYSLVAAKNSRGGARVFSFEPSYMTVASLCANIMLNGLGDRVTPLPLALSDATGMTILSLRDVEPGAGRHTLGPDAPDEGPAVYRQPVLMFRLDDLVDSFGLPLPNHIKLDVDGGELAVLEGARQTLSSPALQSMLVEVSTSLSATVIELLEGCGLHLHSKVSVKNKAGEYAVWYGLFRRHIS
jgi:FkbM family methyltransferase